MITILDLKPGMYVDIKPEVLAQVMRLPPEQPVEITDTHIRYFTAMNRTWKAKEVQKIYTKEEYPEMYL